jgi:hypothetical protein
VNKAPQVFFFHPHPARGPTTHLCAHWTARLPSPFPVPAFCFFRCPLGPLAPARSASTDAGTAQPIPPFPPVRKPHTHRRPDLPRSIFSLCCWLHPKTSPKPQPLTNRVFNAISCLLQAHFYPAPVRACFDLCAPRCVLPSLYDAKPITSSPNLIQQTPLYFWVDFCGAGSGGSGRPFRLRVSVAQAVSFAPTPPPNPRSLHPPLSPPLSHREPIHIVAKYNRPPLFTGAHACFRFSFLPPARCSSSLVYLLPTSPPPPKKGGGPIRLPCTFYLPPLRL